MQTFETPVCADRRRASQDAGDAVVDAGRIAAGPGRAAVEGAA